MGRKCIGLVAGILVGITGMASAADAPVAVSPGNAGRAAVVSGSCPTFNWTAVDGAGAFELVVFRLGLDGERTTEVYTVQLPGGSQGWTPGVERCLEPGERYAWALRAVDGRGEAGPWSEARIFQIAGAPTASEVEQALTVLRRWLDRNEAGAPESVAELEGLRDRIAAPERIGAPQSENEPAEPGTPKHEALDPSAPHVPLDPHERPVPAVPAAAPALGTASLTIDRQVHLGEDSAFFKGDELLLWDDELAAVTGLGHGALGANTTGLNNTATGTLALHENSTGSNNTAFGASAMHETTEGADNTAVGFEALGSNVSGNRNTAVGSDALHLNSTGFNNTAVGFAALGDNSEGIRNTAVGVLALHEADTGNNNTAVGMEALGGNSAGNANASLGYLSLHGNTTGSNNTALGTRSLFSNISGNGNAAVGFEALDLSTGSFNVAVGLDALGGNTSGANNTAIGAGAGINATTGSENIYIGSGALGVAAEANTIRIGGSAVGTGTGEQNRTFINGIRGITVANSAAVLIDANTGQLGTVSSSRRYKEDIQDIDDTSQRLLELRPVTFHYKNAPAEVTGERATEFGLIAEEVAERFPELVVYDEEGRPQTVKYHLLSTLLLNELQRLDSESRTESERVEALEALNRTLDERMREQERDIHRLRAEVSRKR